MSKTTWITMLLALLNIPGSVGNVEKSRTLAESILRLVYKQNNYVAHNKMTPLICLFNWWDKGPMKSLYSNSQPITCCYFRSPDHLTCLIHWDWYLLFTKPRKHLISICLGKCLEPTNKLFSSSKNTLRSFSSQC